MVALSSGMRNTRGCGLPGCGWGVMDPVRDDGSRACVCVHNGAEGGSQPRGLRLMPPRVIPISTNPNPKPSMASMTSPCLSKPAARPARGIQTLCLSVNLGAQTGHRSPMGFEKSLFQTRVLRMEGSGLVSWDERGIRPRKVHACGRTLSTPLGRGPTSPRGSPCCALSLDP